MDPLTHTLSGVVLGNLLAPDPHRMAYAAAFVVATNLPDIDFVTRPSRRLGSPKHYHNLTHSIPGVLLLSLSAAVVSNRLAPAVGWIPFLGIYLLGCTVHLLMDTVITSCYVRLLWPFSHRQFSMGLLAGLNFRTASRKCDRPRYVRCTVCQMRGALFNPVFLFLLAGAGLSLAFPESRRSLALMTVLLAVGYCLAVHLWKGKLRSVLVAAFPDVRPGALHLYPADVIPGRWLAVEECEDRYRLFSLRGIPPRARAAGSIPRPERMTHPAVARTADTPLFQTYLPRMAHPYAEVREGEGAVRVTWKDLRYHQHPGVDLYAMRFTCSPDLARVSGEFRERWGDPPVQPTP